MGAVDTASAAAFLKTRWSPKAIREIMYESPLIALLQKQRTGAEFFKQPVLFGEGGSPSADLLEAITGQTGLQNVAFLVPTVDRFDERVIENKVLIGSEGKDDAFYRQLDMLTENMIRGVQRQIASGLYGDTRATIAVVGSIAGLAITLANPDSTAGLGVGMRLRAAVAGGALRSGVMTITNVDRDRGVITVDALASGLIATDELSVAGNFGLGIAGLAAWCPISSVGLSTPFFSVDRSVDSRLIASRLAAGGYTVASALRQLAARMSRDHAAPSIAVMGATLWGQLVEELSGSIVYDKVAARDDASISFDAITLPLQRGKARVVMDPFCPPNRAYLLSPESWLLLHVGPDLVGFFDQTGRLALAETSAGWKLRCYSYTNLASAQPYANGVAAFDVTTLT